MNFKKRIKYVLEDTFNSYLFQIKSIVFWIKFFFIGGIINFYILPIFSFPILLFLEQFYHFKLERIDVNIIVFIINIFICCVFIIILALKKKPWSILKKEKIVLELLNYDNNKDCYCFKYDMKKLLEDYNLESYHDLYYVSEERLRQIRKDIFQKKYD